MNDIDDRSLNMDDEERNKRLKRQLIMAEDRIHFLETQVERLRLLLRDTQLQLLNRSCNDTSGDCDRAVTEIGRMCVFEIKQ